MSGIDRFDRAGPSVLVVGEALVDIVVRADGARSQHPGGSPLNVAVGLGRLGDTSILATSIGDDAQGAALRDHLELSGVSLAPDTAGTAPTSTATAHLRSDGSADYDFRIGWDISGVAPHSTVLHTGSLAVALAPGRQVVEALVQDRRSESVVTFDPNIRPSLVEDWTEHVSRVERFFALADIVKLSDEDARWLYPDLSDLGVAECILQLGPSVVAVTRGASGSFITDGVELIESNAPRIPVVDTVGAGDSYMAGLIHALIALISDGLSKDVIRSRGWADQDTLMMLSAFAAECAAVTVQRQGADLPWSGDLPSSLLVSGPSASVDPSELT
ncbi:carbohydrate kinase family protein [Microbacterium invictum]|uniref:Fructokinase n=1 Tax=Microbacterium invictum TaxID=515415 RepID=A0AA40SR23_9MICO|nr:MULTISPECIES: carbohydrate kinase [Microbacterium]MBB4140811.1 fructokinase [Microbacterium invictum]